MAIRSIVRMKFIIVLLLFILISPSLSAQEFIGKKRSKAEKMLRFASGEKPVLRFDEKELCMTETYQFNKKADMDTLLKLIIEKKKYEWVPINENQFVTNFKGQLLMELQDDGPPYTLRLLRTAWTRELYEILLKK